MHQQGPWDLHLAPLGPLLEPSWRQPGANLAPLVLNLVPTSLPLGPTYLSKSRFGTQVGQRCPQDSPKDLIWDEFGSLGEPFGGFLGGSGGGLGTLSGANLLHETL